MEDLTEEQIAAFETQLRALREDLVAALSDARTDTVELSSAQGRVSRVDALQQQQMALAEKRRNEARIRAIDAALRRVDDGAYGECTRCGEPIGDKRLEVRPEGPMCLACTRALGG